MRATASVADRKHIYRFQQMYGQKRNKILKISALKYGCYSVAKIRNRKRKSTHRTLSLYGSILTIFVTLFMDVVTIFSLPHSYSIGFSPPWYFPASLQMTLKSHNICLRNAINLEKSLNEIGLKFSVFQRKLTKKNLKANERTRESKNGNIHKNEMVCGQMYVCRLCVSMT